MGSNGSVRLRVGVVQGGRLVEERILGERRVTVGQSEGTLIVPSDGVPRRWRLFERQRGRYRLRLAPSMRATIARGSEVMAADRVVVLPERARGRIALGDATILFQLVRATRAPRPQLPIALRASFARNLDRAFAIFALLSLLLHGALVAYLRTVDWPRLPDITAEPDRFVRQLRRPPPPTVASVEAPAPAPVPAPPRRVRPVVRTPEDRRALVAKVANVGLLQVLGAVGPSGAVRDLLGRGSVDRSQEQALRDLGGVRVAQEGSIASLHTPGTGGRISDVRELRDTGGISVANVSGPAAERRVPVVRVDPPAVETDAPGFDPQTIARAIRAHLAAIRACYERALKSHPDIGGKLVLRFTLTPAGTVSSIGVDEDTLDDPEVTRCVRAVVATWRFAAPPRAVEVSFPFVFQPAGPR
jgi:TonB family protein